MIPVSHAIHCQIKMITLIHWLFGSGGKINSSLWQLSAVVIYRLLTTSDDEVLSSRLRPLAFSDNESLTWRVPTVVVLSHCRYSSVQLPYPTHLFSCALALSVCLPGQGSSEAAGWRAVALTRAPELRSSRGHTRAGRGESTGQRSLRLSWGFHL